MFDFIKKMEEVFKNRTVFITGGSRGIGKAIGLRLAREGANIVIAAKTEKPHPKLEGTIHSAAQEIIKAGGNALPIVVDVRFEDMIQYALFKTKRKFGGVDILINNASAIDLSDTTSLDMKKFDLMHSVNARATFLTTKTCIPYLSQSKNPHVLNLSPPLNLDPKWFAPHVGYTISKYGMSMCVLGMAEELKSKGIAVNALWPKTIIATAAVQNLLGGDEAIKRSRSTEIVADAAYSILSRKSKDCTGNFFIDEDVLRNDGVTCFDKYAVEPGSELSFDLFI